ncbi:MAG: YidC/Oxa1 family membrane protein insertase [Eubacterium sp.]|nr:YidC/Oxa1 family membrane protein insertase [Eubacterium sp.]
MGIVFYNLIIIPIEYVLEFVYVLLKRIINNPGLVIIGVSLVVNFLVLPIYMRADAIQAVENEKQNKMKRWLDHINRSFSGDERFMIIQAYYREMRYKPLNALRTLLPTLFQVPFFIAAYHFLSNLKDLNGASLGPIGNLSKPDALIELSDISLNLLPILMTLINLGSAVIYLKGYPAKSKFQTYVLAFIFLILLYDSPSGLVFYWTLNNIFSLGKNIIMKFLPTRKKEGRGVKVGTHSKWIKGMFPTQLLLTVLVGLAIPSALISSSATEFVVTANPINPLHYVFNTFLVSAGFFLIWSSVFYFISSDQMKKVFQILFKIISVVAVTDYMFFGRNLGIINEDLFFSVFPHFTRYEKLVNIMIIILISFIVIFMERKISSLIGKLYIVLAGALLIVSGRDIFVINEDISANPYLMTGQSQDVSSLFRLSRSGKNVIIFSIDAMVGLYVPYIFAEKPELKDTFDGFVYYRNTLSCGSNTAIGSPGMLGGYEYIPYYSNMRSDVTVEEKNYEYTTVMPMIFAKEGWEVSLCDIPYAGYQDVPDMSIYEGLTGIKGYRTEGYYMDDRVLKDAEEVRQRNMFWYSIFKITPLFAQTTIYDGGRYFSSRGVSNLGSLYSSSFMEAYVVLHRLDELTEITDENTDTFLIINNDIAHDTMTLRLPEYEPSNQTTEGDKDPGFRTDDEGNTFDLTTDEAQPSYYHVNMAACLQIERYLEFLKKQGVYDNTKIIVVSDHGKPLGEFPGYGNPDIADMEGLSCTLMVKDFNAHGFSVSDELMSNADTPTIAMKDVIRNPVNPYTGNPISSDRKKDGLFILKTSDFGLIPGDEYEYSYEDEQKWIHVTDNVYEADNWTELRP